MLRVRREPSAHADRLLLVALTLALVIASGVLGIIEYLNQRQSLLDALGAQARIVADTAAPALVFDDAASAVNVLAPLRAFGDLEGAAIYRLTEGGQYRRFVQIELPGHGHQTFPTEAPPEVDLLHVSLSQRIVVEGEQQGEVVLVAGLEGVFSRLGKYLLTLVLVAAGALAAAYVLTARLRRRVREVEATLAVRANFDELTGLSNRAVFNDRMRHALAQYGRHGGNFALLFFDLDNFKVINDSLGHDAGDQVLCETASRLKKLVRVSDTLCRLGGDEFVAVLEQCESDGAAQVAEEILAALARPYLVAGRQLSLGASLGIALYPRDGQGGGALLRAADTALYAAKAAGKGVFRFFSEELNRRAQERLELETGLRQALVRGEFSLHYQPQVMASNGRVIGAEALLRWHSPEHGDVPPARFIPVAEETGLIHEIGDWVINEACCQLQAWLQASGDDFLMALNLSPLQLREPDLAERVAAALATYDLPPRCLELEITEGALLSHDAEVDANLAALDAQHIRLSLDDFGTGYSSLAYLKRLPISRLKIDRSFVRHLPGGADDAAIVEAIVALARTMDMQVIAEGVETAQQCAAVRAVGCDLIQGWLFGKAVPAAEFEQRFLNALLAVDYAPEALPEELPSPVAPVGQAVGGAD